MPSPLSTQLIEDMKTAMKAKDSVRLEVIRFLRSELKNVEIDQGELDDAGIHKVIKSQIKKMQDVIADYTTAGSTDRVTEEEAKISVLTEYLPEQLSEADIEKVVDEVIANNPPGQMGPIIGQVMAKIGDKADGSVVSKLVKDKLSA